MNIGTKIKEYIEREADKYSETMSKYEHQPSAYRGFLKCSEMMLPLLIYQHDQFTKCLITLSAHRAITQETATMLISTYERQLLQMLGGENE